MKTETNENPSGSDKVDALVGHFSHGEKWLCKCGKENKLDSFYLAAHWDERLVFKCGCGKKYSVKSGTVKRI